MPALSLAPLSEDGRRPENVIWIVLDALRQDVFDAYLKRDGLSSLAQGSTYFPRTFAQGSWTYPSVFSFLTGLYPFNCGVSRLVRQDGGLTSLCADFDDSCPTIFDILRQHGYRVASILDGWGYTLRTTAGQEGREDRYFEDRWGWFCGQGRRYLPLQELRDASLSFVHTAAGTGPFLLFVRSLYTHAPYHGIFENVDQVTRLSRKRWAFALVEGFVRGLQRFERVYLAPLLAALAQSGQLSHTQVILCSDHGDMLWNLEDDLRREPAHPDEEMWRHQLEPYNALIKVPLLIWGAPMRGIYPRRFRLMDVVPTLLEGLGIEYDPAQFDGVSLRRADPRPLYADSAGYGYGGLAFQGAGPKLLMSHRLGAVSYEIAEDEYESLLLRRAASNQVEGVVDWLQRASRIRGLSDGYDEKVLLKRLRALGYVE